MPKPKSRRRLLVAGFVAAALLVATGVAVADGVNPFAGIGAADHTQTPQDILNPALAAEIQHFNAVAARQAAHNGFPERRLLPNTARLVGQLSSGRRFYAVTTTTNELCVIIEQETGIQGTIACGAPLSQAEPTTIETIDQVVNGGDATPPLSYGIAQDGITAVSFMANGSEQTVPVKNNVWFYEGDSDVLASITVHYANGTTQTISH